MSQSGMCPMNRPDAMSGATYYYYVYCGGSGAAACLLPLGVTGYTYAVRIPKFITHNLRLVFQNPLFGGVRIMTDAGDNGTCPHSLGSDVPCYIALSVDGNLTPAQIVAQGIILTGPCGYEIEFKELRIPQPKDPLWDGKIYVQLYWGNVGYMNGGGASFTLPDTQLFTITKHDYEILQ